MRYLILLTLFAAGCCRVCCPDDAVYGTPAITEVDQPQNQVPSYVPYTIWESIGLYSNNPY